MYHFYKELREQKKENQLTSLNLSSALDKSIDVSIDNKTLDTTCNEKLDDLNHDLLSLTGIEENKFFKDKK
jgi:hypothetical protein